MIDTKQALCKKHGVCKHSLYINRKNRRWRCNPCIVDAVTKRRKEIKRKLVQLFGVKCVKCGYDKSLAALSFHHKDPSIKEFTIAGCAAVVAWEKVLEEAQKCELLCANCHMELHETPFL